MNSEGQAPVESLNEFQASRLRVTCEYIDKLLSDVEGVLNTSASQAAFPRYFPDIAPAQRRTIDDYIGRLRAQLLGVLVGQGISVPGPSIPATRAVRVMLGAVDIAVEELKPHYMLGYGHLPESVATELNGIVGELSGLVSRLERYLAQGVGQDQRVRVERLEAVGNDLRLLKEIEQVVRERALVEFRPAIAAILDRAEDQVLEVAVFGRVSAGKSALLNAILDTDVLPVGVTPITAVPIRISYAAAPSLTVSFSEAATKTFEIGRLAEFATEQHNPGNSKHVARIAVGLPSARLRGGVAFVDTPGLGALATSGAAETIAYLPKCDLGVVLIDAGSTLTADDLQTIAALQEAAIPVNVLLSKADLLSADDRQQFIQYVIGNIASECRMELAVHPVSVLPSHREMTDRWFECEIVPLYGESRELRAASLRRKIGILRESVAAALRARMGRGRQLSASARERVRAAAALLRRTTGEIEEMGAACERAIDAASADVPEAIQSAASRLLGSWSRNDGGPVAPGQMVRDVVAYFVQQRVKRLQDDLVAFATQLQGALNQSASDIGLADVPGDGEFQSAIRGTPIFDPQQFAIVVSRPSISMLLGRRFAERQLAARIERQLGEPFRESVDAYWRLLKDWSRSIVGQLKQRFESYAENHRARAEQALGGFDGNAGELEGIQQSLASLEGDAVPPSILSDQAPQIAEARTTTA
jgi:GTP-binding protein EngB required for normal cell division